MDARTTERDTENRVTWNEQVHTRKISFIKIDRMRGWFTNTKSTQGTCCMFKAVSSSAKVQKTEFSPLCSTLFEEHSHKAHDTSMRAELPQWPINWSRNMDGLLDPIKQTLFTEVYTVHRAAKFKNDSWPTEIASVTEAIAHQHTFICNEQMTRTNISGF